MATSRQEASGPVARTERSGALLGSLHMRACSATQKVTQATSAFLGRVSGVTGGTYRRRGAQHPGICIHAGRCSGSCLWCSRRSDCSGTGASRLCTRPRLHEAVRRRHGEINTGSTGGAVSAHLCRSRWQLWSSRRGTGRCRCNPPVCSYTAGPGDTPSACTRLCLRRGREDHKVNSSTPKRAQLTYTAAVPELESRLAGAAVASDRVEAVLVAGAGLLALVYVCVNGNGRCQTIQPQRKLGGRTGVPVQLRPSAVLLKPRPHRITHRYEPMVFSQSWPLRHTFPSSEHSSMSARTESAGLVGEQRGVRQRRCVGRAHTLASPAVGRDRQASRTRAVVGAHGVVTSMRTRVTGLTLVLVCRT